MVLLPALLPEMPCCDPARPSCLTVPVLGAALAFGERWTCFPVGQTVRVYHEWNDRFDANALSVWTTRADTCMLLGYLPTATAALVRTRMEGHAILHGTITGYLRPDLEPIPLITITFCRT